ncbi:hypothetical protein [Lawsonibacter hominis]|uniref:hypothetical protein n=1 Tax=Lawsonibacter hominis TaxID=2763053 RepID=UPI00332C8123
MRVSDMLLEGKESAITGSRLVDALELKDLREFTQLIEGERRAGSPICASTGSGSYGYYLAKGPAELEDYMGSLDRRIRNVSRAWKHLEATLLRMTGQEKMGGC